jgi:hypothetical protein
MICFGILKYLARSYFSNATILMCGALGALLLNSTTKLVCSEEQPKSGYLVNLVHLVRSGHGSVLHLRQ